MIVINADYRLAPQVKIEEIFQDVKDVVEWAKSELPQQIGPEKVDTESIVIAGGSSGGYLALLTGLYLDPPPKAIIALYPMADPTHPNVNTATKPNPPLGRDSLIPFEEVAQYLDEKSVPSSHPSLGLNIKATQFEGRAKAFSYMAQEGTYLKYVYGEDTPIEEIQRKWVIPHVIASVNSYPPTLLIHTRNDRYTPYAQSVDVAEALQKKGFSHDLWIVEGDYDHGFDSDDVKPGEEDPFAIEFANRIWTFVENALQK
ncbi:hypothetical protein K7432_004018 [Basidiobolus ranarum]